MRRFYLLMILQGLVLSAWAQTNEGVGKTVQENGRHDFSHCGFYLKIGSGASFSNKAHISAPSDAWSPAIQGYNSGLGTAPIVLSALGYDTPYAIVEVSASYRPDYTYKKFQTSPMEPFNVLGARTRRFNLDISSVMFSLYFSGRGFNHVHCRAGNGGIIYPILGGGAGSSQLKMYNFRSTGLPPIDPNFDFPTFESENQYAISYRFTYQLMGGLEYRYRDLCALSFGYRWFDISRFRGPRYVRSSEGLALDVQSDTWKIKFNANEAFVEFKVFW